MVSRAPWTIQCVNILACLSSSLKFSQFSAVSNSAFILHYLPRCLAVGVAFHSCVCAELAHHNQLLLIKVIWLFFAFHMPAAQERVGFVVMVMVSCHWSSSDPVVILWSVVEPNSSFTGKHIVSMHCLKHSALQNWLFLKYNFDIQSPKNLTTMSLFVYERDKKKEQKGRKKESELILKIFGKRYGKRQKASALTPYSQWLNTYQALLIQTPHISLHTCTFWHLTHTCTFHLHAARLLSLPSTHTTHYRSTKKASEKTAHKHVSIRTEFEFVFTGTRESATHSTSVFHAFLKRAWSVQKEDFCIQLRRSSCGENHNCTKHNSELE